MTDQSNNKTIAKNTIFLYFRMIVTMVVSLYTSRVILSKLGIEDYGIYQAVGGIVGFLSFINNALASGSSRFLTYALGENNFDKLKQTFSTTLNVHILLALVIVIIAETGGLWFLHNKMVIAPERLSAAVYTFHLSILAAVFTLTQVPYNAIIIAHERMSIFAYFSIYEVFAKLGICYLLTIGSCDRLILYAALILFVHITLMCAYRMYCVRNFREAKYSFFFDKKIFKEIASFSSWSLFSGSSIALNSQGVLVLLNMFFSSGVVAARAISLQVNSAANLLVANFRQAVNPQIIKKIASGDYEGSKYLLLESTKYSYYLMYMLSLPISILAKPLLKLWLVNVPDYTVPFLQIVIIQSLFQVFDTSFYTALYAKGRLKENALISPTLGFVIFPITYFLFKLGYSPLVLSWTSLGVYAILGCLVKPILIIKIANYKWRDVLSVYRPCMIVTILSFPIPVYLGHLLDTTNVFYFILVFLISVLTVVVVVYLFGLNKGIRRKIIKKIRMYFSRKL